MTQIQNAIYQMKETSMNIGSMVKTGFWVHGLQSCL